MKKLLRLRFCFLLVIHGFLIGSMNLQAQQIIIDKLVKAGDLTLFPEMGNENVYYYLPDQLRLASHENGKPQFSFLKYVDNTRSAPGADDIREGEGGGILHAVISLSVTPEQLAEAKNELRQINSEGILKGPVIYNSGTMTIISSFANTEGELTKQVVGIGRAPLIDGQNAAVSMELTKKGAKILWESFKTPTPDISFSFEMELSGFRSPIKALIEADFEKMYKHEGFQLGTTGNYGNVMFGGEIELAFDELRNNGAIKITNMGSDAEMDKLVETAYNKLTSAMFDPIGTGNPVIQGLMKSASGNKSALDRATDLYKQGEKKSATKSSTKGKKASLRHIYPSIDDVVFWASNNPQMSSAVYHFPSSFAINLDEWEAKHIKEHYTDFIRLLDISEEKKKEAIEKIDADEYVNPGVISKGISSSLPLREYMLSDEEKEKYHNVIIGAADPGGLMELVKQRVKAIIYKQDFLNEKQKDYILNISVPDESRAWDLNLALTYIAWINRDGIVYMPESAKYAAMAAKIEELKDMPLLPITGLDDKDVSENPMDSLGLGEFKLPPPNSEVGEKPKGGVVGATAVASKKASSDKKGNDTTKKAAVTKTGFKMAVMASYQFKKIKQKGTFKINLNKYTADKLTLRFDENIGRIDCDECFFEVNLDDPMFKQREIVAILDGFNFDDFGKYINYVNLKMKKKHQNGELTVDEVRIDRDNFRKAANNFKLMYGWKGDNDRSKWFDYEVQAQWSFFGGYDVSDNWEQVNANVVNLAAPYLRKTIELEADPEMLKEKQVRSVNVKIYYKVGEKEQVEVVSLLPSRDQYSETVDILMPNGTFEYDYEISWRLYGNKTQSSGRQTTSESILFVDEL